MRRTRRAYLAALGGTITIGTAAGCLGGTGSGDGSDSGDGSGGEALPDGCDVGTLDSVSSLPRPAIGPEDAPVTVDVFEDYACPHCQTFTQSVYPEIKSTYVDAGDVRYRFFDFPIPVNEKWSWAAASAARAVQDRSDAETFFAFTEGVYENQERLGDDGHQVVHDLANDLGVDGCEVAAAAEQEPYRDVVEADRNEGSERDVPGTPAVYVDGELLDGYDWETVRDAVESRLDG